IRALRKTCGLYGILPTSYTVTCTLSKSGKRPLTPGGFADVWRLTGTDEDNRDCVFARANHPNVLSIEGVAPNLFEFCMVSQWMPNGNMLKYMEQYPGANRLELLIGVTRGLNYLH
ncbi:hypothetical protein BDM02DRAFT_3070496, partial [Thelephora ganbajun]